MSQTSEAIIDILGSLIALFLVFFVITVAIGLPIMILFKLFQWMFL